MLDHNKIGPLAQLATTTTTRRSPQSGPCPGGRHRAAGQRQVTIWRNNKVYDNNNPNVPGNSTNGLASASPIGSGIVLAGTRQVTLYHNTITGNGSWGVLVADLPDQEYPPTATNGENCQGGVYLIPPGTPGQAPLCYFQALGNQVIGNSFASNGGFGNPTNGDVALFHHPQHRPGPTAPVSNADCFTGNTDPAGLTSDPPAVQSDPLLACGKPSPGNPDPALVVQAECAAQLFAMCPPVPGLNYPRPKAHFPLPMPGVQPTMPDPCAGIPGESLVPGAALTQFHPRRLRPRSKKGRLSCTRQPPGARCARSSRPRPRDLRLSAGLAPARAGRPARATGPPPGLPAGDYRDGWAFRAAARGERAREPGRQAVEFEARARGPAGSQDQLVSTQACSTPRRVSPTPGSRATTTTSRSGSGRPTSTRVERPIRQSQ